MSAFNILDVPRELERAEWLKLWRTVRKYDRPSRVDDSILAERAQIAQEIRDCTEEGMVCVVTSGRDCDMSEFTWVQLVANLSPMKFWGDRQDSYYWADGPMHIGICKPSERPEAYSRDLALEAFEDGHPHIVSSVRFDEEGMY